MHKLFFVVVYNQEKNCHQEISIIIIIMYKLFLTIDST